MSKISINKNLLKVQNKPSLPRTNISENKNNLINVISSTFGVSIGLGFYYVKNQKIVSCEKKNGKNRLRGTAQEDKALKFNWTLFWKYLKPHLLRLFGAIVVSTLT